MDTASSTGPPRPSQRHHGVPLLHSPPIWASPESPWPPAPHMPLSRAPCQRHDPKTLLSRKKLYPLAALAYITGRQRSDRVLAAVQCPDPRRVSITRRILRAIGRGIFRINSILARLYGQVGQATDVGVSVITQRYAPEPLWRAGSFATPRCACRRSPAHHRYQDAGPGADAAPPESLIAPSAR